MTQLIEEFETLEMVIFALAGSDLHNVSYVKQDLNDCYLVDDEKYTKIDEAKVRSLDIKNKVTISFYYRLKQ